MVNSDPGRGGGGMIGNTLDKNRTYFIRKIRSARQPLSMREIEHTK